MKQLWIVLLVLGTIFVTVNLFVNHYEKATRHAAQQAAWQKAKAERAAELNQAVSSALRIEMIIPTPSAPEPVVQPVATPMTDPPHAPVVVSDPVNAGMQAVAGAAQAVQASGGKPPLQDPVARLALSFAGADPEAEEIWAEAINNPDLPPNERKDLIEDLNEDGFPDPKNITLDDLPLILGRIELIEEHAPEAMDEVNYAAFLEAYQDLQKMLVRLGAQ